MLSTESTLVRAFTRRRPQKPPPPLTQEAFQRRQAALRQMGLLPALSLSQQEAQLDTFIPPSAPILCDSEADRIKNDWVAKNTTPSDEHDHFQSFKFGGTPLPSPPLTPNTPDFAPEPTIQSDDSSPPLTPQSDSPINLILNQDQPHSPFDALPFRSPSPSLVASDSKSTRSTSRAPSLSPPTTHHPVPLPPLPASPINSDSPHSDSNVPNLDPPSQKSKPQPPQRKKTVFARFKRANTVDPSSVSSPSNQRPPTPTRSKSLFSTVRKTVFGSSPNVNTSAAPPTPALPPPSTLAQDSESQPNVDVVLQVNSQLTAVDVKPPLESSAEPHPGQPHLLGKVDFPTSSDDCQLDDSNHDHDRERSPSMCTTNLSVPTSSPRKRKGTGKGIGISLILNRERTTSSSPQPASPLSSSFLSPPASPTSTQARLRGRLSRKGTVGSGTDGLLSVWGGVTGLLGAGAAPSIFTNGSGSDEGADGEVRQAVAPTIHNEASILLHMSSIEDEETRRVTEVAFM